MQLARAHGLRWTITRFLVVVCAAAVLLQTIWLSNFISRKRHEHIIAVREDVTSLVPRLDQSPTMPAPPGQHPLASIWDAACSPKLGRKRERRKIRHWSHDRFLRVHKVLPYVQEMVESYMAGLHDIVLHFAARSLSPAAPIVEAQTQCKHEVLKCGSLCSKLGVPPRLRCVSAGVTSAPPPPPSSAGLSVCDELSFLHIPKNAGTFIEYNFGPSILNCTHWGVNSPVKSPHAQVGLVGGVLEPEPLATCSSWHQPLAVSGGTRDPSAEVVFCIVRHPFRRLLSEAFYQSIHVAVKALSVNGKLSNCGGLMLAQILASVSAYADGRVALSDCHLLAQVHYVFPVALDPAHPLASQPALWMRERPRSCNHVVRYENMTEELVRLAHAAGRVDVTVDAVHKLAPELERVHIENFCLPGLTRVKIPDELRALIRTVYADDFAAFGYDPNDIFDFDLKDL
eukprot:Amastigsp_a843973_9.p1 type:complete len:456 gc:universal Amastigsp_a843973_9:1507-140(-)